MVQKMALAQTATVATPPGLEKNIRLGRQNFHFWVNSLSYLFFYYKQFQYCWVI